VDVHAGKLKQGADMSIIGTDSNDFLDGTLGDDTIDGGAGDDTLRGLAGNDLLIGGAGADTYLLPKGFGQDSIAVGSADVIALDVPISDLIVGQWGAPAAFTVALSFKNSTDSLTLSRADYDYGDPKFQFANGITINWSVITSESQEPIGRALSGTTGNDTIDGSDAFKYINTTRHNLIDTLSGGLGDDTYLVDSRYGYLLSDQGQWVNIFDQVIEKPGEGIDTVLLPYGSSKYTLPVKSRLVINALLEQLRLFGVPVFQCLNG
jgi:hypothetical protein